MPIQATLLGAAAAAAMAAAAPAARAQAPIVLACNLPARPVPGATAPPPMGDRIFRLSPGSLQEWEASHKRFGVNLCGPYSCARTAGKTEGTITSASVSYTIGVAGGMGYWRVQGATGGGPRSGSCRIVTEPKA